MKKIGAPLTLSEANVKDGIGLIVEHGFTVERMNNNPRKINEENLKEILKVIE